MSDPTVGSHHARIAEADAYWRQFVVPFYFNDPGDEVTGAVLHLGEDRTAADLIPRLRIQQKDGRVYVVTAHQARLRSELVKAAPAVGDRVRITYNGEADKAAPGMNKAKEFTVEVRRQNPPPSERPDGRTSGEVNPSENAKEAGIKTS
jgi:hypothetical protein